MTFAHPWVLLGLLALPLLALLKGRVGRRAAFLYSSVDLVRGLSGVTRSRAGAVLLALRWLAVGLFLIALARPQKGEGDAKITASGVDIVVAFDLSSSMLSEDFTIGGKRVNRVEIAKRTLEEFIRRRSSDRIGLVAFAGRAYVASPLTLDHDFLQQNLERLHVGLIEDKTAIGSALTAALNRLREVQSKSKIVILMTDGQNNAGKVPPLTAAEAAEALGVKVYTIGVGIRGEAPYPVTDVFGRRGYQMVPVDIDDETLTKVAEKTGGKYFRADSSETLRTIYSEIDRLEKTEVEVKKYQRYSELFHWFALAGLALVFVEVALANTLWRRIP